MKKFWKNLGENNLNRFALVTGIIFIIAYYTVLIIHLFKK